MSNSADNLRWILRLKLVRFGLIPTLSFLLLIWVWPYQEPIYSYSTVINDRNGDLLSASVSQDGQWRFPAPDSIPYKVQESIRLFEDEYFYYHPGINPGSVLRAFKQNIQAGKRISGASTLTMQIARMMGGNKRTVWNKVREMLIALKLELRYSKSELFTKYVSLAPFGGNVVGLEAASWRYYGKAPYLLSWGEAATLAVLPNQPGAIYPGTRDSVLIAKRNRLLEKLFTKGHLDQTAMVLAQSEPIPSKPLAIPTKARHLLTTSSLTQSGARINSTLDPTWQSQVSRLAENHQVRMSGNGVENLAAMVIDLSTGHVLAYKGNTDNFNADGHQVDVIRRRRSPGSTLKPLLFAAALDEGIILRKTLLPDVPTFFGGFSPQNFNRGHSGAVPANVALSRSLNIPLAHLLNEYTYEQFHYDLKDWGFSSLDKPAGHYGLSIILGGGEVTMWEMAQVYFSLFKKVSGLSNQVITIDTETKPIKDIDLDKGAIWQTFQTMTALARPEGEKSWRSFSSSKLISWKTGTSFGSRDAWAIGLDGEVLVLVWVGNADGEGRADLTGIKAAAPLFHQIMRLSSSDNNWLEELKPKFLRNHICQISGLKASANCPSTQQDVMASYEEAGICPYHQSFLMDANGTYQVSSDCYSIPEATSSIRFVLPSNQAYYYKKDHPEYKGPPPQHPDCTSEKPGIAILYPHPNSSVFIPNEIDGSRGQVVFQATHAQENITLYWHINDQFLGTTKADHQIGVWLPPGEHVLSLSDPKGNTVKRSFKVIGDTE